MRKFLFVITENHLHSRRADRKQLGIIYRTIGLPQRQDIGKYVYDVGGVIQIENNEQRDVRVANGA